MGKPKAVTRKQQKKKKPTTDDDENFINLFKELNALDTLDHQTTNEIIKKYYPTLPFDTKNIKTHIRPLVKWKMNNMKDHQLTIERIFELIDQVYPKLYTNVATLDNVFTNDVRQPVFKRWPDVDGENSIQYVLAKEMVALPDDIKGKLLKDASDKVEAKNRDYDVVDADEIYKIIKDNIVSTNPFRRAIALLLASGSREMELFATSTYKPITVPSGEKNWIIQGNVSKKKGVEVSVKKPVLYFTAEKFVEEVESMRSSINEKYKNIVVDGKLSSSVSTAGNKAAHEIFKNRKGFTMHVCRKIYAHMSYDLYESKETIHGKGTTLSFWIASVLAHEGQKAVANYSHIKLKHKLNTTEVPAKTEELITKVEELEERLDTLNIDQQDERPLPSVIVKNSKAENQMKKVDTIFKQYVTAHGGAEPNQTRMEQLAKQVAPRRIIRLYMKFKDEL